MRAKTAGWCNAMEVFFLPAMFVVRDGAFYGPVQASLQDWDIRQQMRLALDGYPGILP